MILEQTIDRLRSIYGARRWIIATDALAGATRHAEALRTLGAEACLCIGATTGTGPLPEGEFTAGSFALDVKAATITEGMRAAADALAHLDAASVARVDAFDPGRVAQVLGSITDDGRPVAGRRKFGARLKAWQELEDKTTIHTLWEQVGAPQAPFEVVPARLGALEAAAARLDQGAGTVQAGDAREGFNGGAEYLRWVQSPAHQRAAAEFFGEHCDTVRVMPFLEGIPCSVHGLVFPDYTAVFRPCEMLVFRKPGQDRLHYGRAATFWDPPGADREALRALARRTGAWLHEQVGYRGAFTIDGILTAGGFVPTELNPRFGAALGMIGQGLPELPLTLLNMAIVEGVEIDWQPRELERLILDVADARRAGGTMATTTRSVAESQTWRLVFEGAEGPLREARAEEPCDATLNLGPGAMGGFAFASFDAERTPRGPSTAPRAIALLAWADAHLQLGIGALEPARDVRRASDPP